MFKSSLYTLFHYQERCVQSCLDYLHGPSKKRAVVVAPTAAGKSLIISSTAQRWGRPCLVLQPSSELLEQNIDKLFALGGEAYIYSASLSKKELGFLTYATLGSIKNIIPQLKAMGIDTLLIDECHYKYPPEPGSMFRTFVDEFKPKKVIGFTATPFRLYSEMEGSKLKIITQTKPRFFNEFLHVIQVQEIIAEGRWSPLDYSYFEFDESQLALNTSGSDFTEESIRQAIKDQKINNSIYREIVSLHEECRGILVFMDSIENAKIMAEFLQSRSICSAAYIYGDMPSKERARIIKAFKAGKIKVLLNFGILTTGFDYQELDCIIMGRPTASLAMWYQIVGRGTRVHPDKPFCRILDFCNNLKRFGKVENLVVEEIPEWGWAVTNKDVILTNTFMGQLRVTKEDVASGKVGLDGVRKMGMMMFFGKYKGKYVSEIPINTLKWYLENVDFTKYPKMMALKKEMEQILLENAQSLQKISA